MDTKEGFTIDSSQTKSGYFYHKLSLTFRFVNPQLLAFLTEIGGKPFYFKTMISKWDGPVCNHNFCRFIANIALSA